MTTDEFEATLNLRSVIARVGDTSLSTNFRTPQSLYLEQVCGRISRDDVVIDLTRLTHTSGVLTRPVG